MLRASRRVLRPGGRLAFHTIELPPGLTPAKRRRAISIGPPAVTVRTTYPGLLRSAGFNEIDEVDQTAEYLATQHRWLAATLRHEEGLRLALGGDAVEEGIGRRRRTVNAIEEGLLLRTLYTATR
ncbi:MAG: hypothetical protein ACI9N0_002394 [Ilumatobacter sp.]